MRTKYVMIAIIAVLATALVYLLSIEPETITEVITRHDTVTVHYPVAHDTIRTDRVVRIPIPCGISEDDSCIIQIAEQRHYVDTSYEAWVSGIEPQLDSIRVFNKTIIKTVTKEHIVYKPFTPKEKSVMFGGFVNAQSSFGIDHVNIQGGAELTIKSLGIKAGYNIGEYNYPFIGVEYKIR